MDLRNSGQGISGQPKCGQANSVETVHCCATYEHHVHPGMQEAYPGLSNWQSQLGIGTIQEPAGATNLARNRLVVDAPNLQWARSIGIHELKHLIDRIEKHPPGGSPHQFMEVAVPEREAHDLYNRLVGEVAARNAQKRLDWGDIIRRLRRPAATEDVPRDRQFNLYDDTWP